MKNKLASLIFVMASLVSNASFAATVYDGSQLFKKVSSVEVTNNLRVRIEGNPSLCGTSTPTWAYLNETDVNYKAITAALLAAKALNQSIHFFANKDASGNCKIGQITIM